MVILFKAIGMLCSSKCTTKAGVAQLLDQEQGIHPSQTQHAKPELDAIVLTSQCFHFSNNFQLYQVTSPFTHTYTFQNTT
jgi:hypothetical protein